MPPLMPDARPQIAALLERVRRGDQVHATWDGDRVSLRLSSGKLSRLKRQHAWIGDPEDFEKVSAEIYAEIQSGWLKAWDEI